MKFKITDLRKVFKNINESRYPYTYHHDFVRSERATNNKRYLTRANVAMIDNLIKDKIGNIPAMNQLEYGAILYLAKQEPHAFIRAMRKRWFADKVIKLAEKTMEHPNHYDGTIYNVPWYPKDW